MKKTKNEIKVNENSLTVKEQSAVIGGGESISYYCTKCDYTTKVLPHECPVCGTVGGFAVSGRTST